MTSDRAWVLLPSGRYLDLLAPNPAAWTDRDLALALAGTARWGGHSKWDLPLSVAQHSLLVLALRQQMQPAKILNRPEALRELLHDADEGLLGFDPISPLKPHLGPAFAAVTSSLQEAVARRYEVTSWPTIDFERHKAADRLAAASEAVHVAGWTKADIRDSLGITATPLDIDPVSKVSGFAPWQPWPRRLAAALFLGKLRELTQPDQLQPAPANLDAVIEREMTVRTLAANFARSPSARRARCRIEVTGSTLTDTLVYAEAGDGSEWHEGIVVDAERDDDGQLDLEGVFTIFTAGDELVVCYGHNCNVHVS